MKLIIGSMVFEGTSDEVLKIVIHFQKTDNTECNADPVIEHVKVKNCLDKQNTNFTGSAIDDLLNALNIGSAKKEKTDNTECNTNPVIEHSEKENTQNVSDTECITYPGIKHVKVKYWHQTEGTNFTGSVIDDDGNIAYYLNGHLHDVYQAALQLANGDKEWYCHGQFLREEKGEN